ncbi:hypothetical protein GE061_000214 [Apolygus lucorum]|uniref:Peptidase C1A papain C-terminal domain-containing protein n=1 Tax=Apolygus lucorum TaxID=248454 RepID=A0A8S9Y561_APOLU|nr:hypothetical protein GE061_000214 [Apolygus lucorum]
MEAVEGKSVELPCNVTPPGHDKVYMIFWFREDAGIPFYRLASQLILEIKVNGAKWKETTASLAKQSASSLPSVPTVVCPDPAHSHSPIAIPQAPHSPIYLDSEGNSCFEGEYLEELPDLATPDLQQPHHIQQPSREQLPEWKSLKSFQLTREGQPQHTEMYTVLVFASLIGCCLAASISLSEWEAYKSLYGKIYEDPEEDAMRKMTYEMNLEKFEAHNARHQQGLESYTLGVNHLSDWSNSELQLLNGFRHSEELEWGTQIHQPSGLSLPASIDWREKNVVTSVKQQGQCGSCWAFSATGAVESTYAIKTGKLVNLSEQQLVDCDLYDLGCTSGDPQLALAYLSQNGQEPLSDYPYDAKQGVCEFKPSDVSVKISSYTRIPRGDEKALQDAIATVGPVSVAMDARLLSGYTGGIFDPPICLQDSLDHAVLVVGYGTTESGEDYYMMKNSWGPNWGDHGYFKMRRNANNLCGIANHAYYPVM